MSAISGIVNLKSESEISGISEKICLSASHRGKHGTFSEYKSKRAVLSAFSIEPLPLSLCLDGTKYTIVYDGEIYNIDEIKSYLSAKYNFSGKESVAEILLILYHICGNAFLKHINGVFSIAIWNEANYELILARDRFGIKPLYYTFINDTLVFSSEIKGILASGMVKPELTIDGICHLLGIGPNVEQGNGILKDIFELLPATLASFNLYGFKIYKYWELKSAFHTDSLEDTVDKVYLLTCEAIKRQIKNKEGKLCCFLSGGLDSSIITAITAKEYKELNTFSIEYTGNDEYFEPNEYQPDSDISYINKMSEFFGTKHKIIKISSEDLKELLPEALIARDHPGMGDIDSSLFMFCREVGKSFDYAMSGECADEVFGGYPWFHRSEDFASDTFPWSKNIGLRESILNKKTLSGEALKEYIDKIYNTSVKEVPIFYPDSKEEKRRREIAYLNLNWFMYSLGERSERIGCKNGLNIQMPFADYKLIEYVFNIPWEFKAHGGREKGLLRKCFTKDLPEEIVLRKKSPYPKTHNPIFEEIIKEQLKEVLSCSDRRIFSIIDKDSIISLMNEKSDYAKPWFGQLMALPQLYAYLIQLDCWLEKYDINLII